jgi:hypothetical protein
MTTTSTAAYALDELNKEPAPPRRVTFRASI